MPGEESLKDMFFLVNVGNFWLEIWEATISCNPDVYQKQRVAPENLKNDDLMINAAQAEAFQLFYPQKKHVFFFPAKKAGRFFPSKKDLGKKWSSKKDPVLFPRGADREPALDNDDWAEGV